MKNEKFGMTVVGIAAAVVGVIGAVATESMAQVREQAGAVQSALVPRATVMSVEDLWDPEPRDVAAMLSTIHAFSLQDVAVPDREVPFSFEARLMLGDRAVTLELTQHSVRAAGFRVMLQLGGGETVMLDPGPVRTYRGTAAELPGSIVSATLFKGGHLTARIATPDQGVWWVEDVRELGESMHVVYRESDLVADPHHRCGVVDGDRVPPVAHDVPGGSGGYGPRASVVQATIAFECDYEYVSSWGSSAATEIEGILNDDNVIYEAETSICHRIRAIGLWGSDNDPYINDDASTILNAFKDSWNTYEPMASDFRHVAQLISGKDFDGDTVGLAKRGGIKGCQLTDTVDRSMAYSIIEALVMRSRRVHNSCHELGHNWDASHCDGDSTCGIMNSTIDSWPIPGQTTFGTTSANLIITTRRLLESCTRDCDFVITDAVCTGYCVFPTASSAHASAAAGTTVRFYPKGLRDNASGTYNEQFRWTRPMTLTAPQAPVVIGR